MLTSETLMKEHCCFNYCLLGRCCCGLYNMDPWLHIAAAVREAKAVAAPQAKQLQLGVAAYSIPLGRDCCMCMDDPALE